MPAKKSTLTKADIERELIALDRITQALNTAVVALYYLVKPDGKALDKVTPEEYVKYMNLINKALKELKDKEEELEFEPLSEAGFDELIGLNKWPIPQLDIIDFIVE